ncbi:hypothetical protein BG011_003224 [Mortierella polycephala]|uniref:Crinkler effector protein N-terminal domain-containing protein n=1 Tax=Mortierella polycephala TaxID=41804 RepID=A0A9P6Q2S7_9FUNG|nr:hypothetical protein BG011_003224 [Mortierella polycephala]
MTKTLFLFCLISGELASNAFPVKISSDETVGQLKKLIKTEKPNALEGIDAKDLVLWRVTIPVNEYDEDEIITTDKVDAKRLLKGTETLSKAFKDGAPGDTIHIIITQPKGTPKALGSETKIAKLREEIEGLRGENIVRFNVILRPNRSDCFSWTTDTKTASIKGFLESIYIEYPHREDSHAVLAIIHPRGAPQYEGGETKYPSDDEQFRGIIRRYLKTNTRKIIVALETPTKKYTDFTLTEVNNLYEISNMDVPGIRDLPRFDGISTEALDSDLHKESLRRLLDEIDSGIRAMPLSSPNDAICSAYIRSFLIQAILIFERTLMLCPKRAIRSRNGHGKVDYSIEATSVEGMIRMLLGVTEVKNDEFEKGVAQNIVQLESLLTTRKCKRSDDDDEEGEENGPVPMKAYGIVTNASVWYFVECSIGDVSSDDPNRPKFRISELSEIVNYRKNTWREDATAVLGQIVWLMRKVVSEIPKRELRRKG